MRAQELDQFGATLNESFPHLNESTKGLYARSVQHHHQELLQTLYPFVNKSPKMPRTVAGVRPSPSTLSVSKGARLTSPTSLQLRESYKIPRGIIIPCGNEQFIYAGALSLLSSTWTFPSHSGRSRSPLLSAVHLIATLKHVHNTALPIHVVYAGSDDLVPEKRAALRSIHPSVDTVDLLNYFDETHVGIHGGGWAIKSFAVLASPFEEVIIADADAIFVQDPERLLDEDPGYNATGTLFFRDREIFAGWGQVRPYSIRSAFVPLGPR